MTVGLVPLATLTKFPPPLFCLTVTVNVWGWPTSFVASGVILMLASTNVFTTGPEPPGPAPTLAVAGSVSRVSETPPAFTVTDALPVTCPAEFDVNVTVH